MTPKTWARPALAIALALIVGAAGALVATRHGCSASMPTLGELQALIADNEGAATAAHTN